MVEEVADAKVWICSMNMRGKWAPLPEGAKRVNVTSAQSKSSLYRLAFSPMTTTGYKGFNCFENYWQSAKRYEGLTDDSSLKEQEEWWKKQTKGKRRYPKGKRKRVLHADFPEHGPLQYVESRKLVYVPEYYDMIKDNSVLKNLQDVYKNGQSIAVYDFDGPRTEDGEPTAEEITLDFLRKKIEYVTHPFGHGYVVAAAIKGYEPSLYI